MAVRRLDKSWQYDFTLEGHGRRRKAGFRTKAEAREAERRKREELILGQKRFHMADAYEMYLSATMMRPGSRDNCQRFWRDVESHIGHLYIEEVDTSLIDELRSRLSTRLGPESINNRVKIVRAVLRFMWKRGHLKWVPYVPMESAPERATQWYTEEERDRLLTGMFEMYPQWYAFFYLTTRLGLRTGEVYAISRDRIRDIPPQLIVDRSVQRGNKERPAMLGPRKNNKVLTLALTEDVVDAIRWHIREGYAGPEFLFSKDGCFPTRIYSHALPLRAVQRALGLREIGHHRVGRHSVASQAATGGHSIKAIQAQLGHTSARSTHQYAHLGQRAQLRIVEALQPASPPHVNVRSTNENGQQRQMPQAPRITTQSPEPN